MKFINWQLFKENCIKELGVPYVYGAEVASADPHPKAFDCSEYVQWAYSMVGIEVPDGAQNQYMASSPVTRTLQAGDLGFFIDEETRKVKHVGILLDDATVIEARGFEPTLEAAGILTERVLTRPRINWEHWHEFSGWRRLDCLK